jgi:hypothetical protein
MFEHRRFAPTYDRHVRIAGRRWAAHCPATDITFHNFDGSQSSWWIYDRRSRPSRRRT